MALSDNAIGFFLEAEDVSLSKTLKTAATNYEKYTKALEDYNERAFKSTQSGMGSVKQLLKSVSDLPSAVEKSMKKASGTIEKGLRPITQKVDLAISVGSATKLKKIFGQAVADAMSGANIRMTSAMPQKRMAMFQRGVGLRAQYSDVVQPPDMKGKIRPLKKFAKGGVVEGPAGIDKILALLTKDEMVLPADVSKDLQKAAGGRLKTAGGKFASAKELGEMVAGVTNLSDALEKMKGGLEAGVGTEQDMEAYQKGVAELTDRVANLADAQSDLSFTTKVRLGPVIMQTTKRLEEFGDQVDETGTKSENLLSKILGPARFLAISKGVETLQEGFKSLTTGASNAFSTIGGDEIGSFFEEIKPVNKVLQLSRKEFREFRLEYAAAADAAGAELNAAGASANALVDAGVRGKDQLMRLGPLITNMAVSSKIGVDKLAESAFLLEGAYKLSTDEVAALFNDMRKFGATAAISTEALFEGLTDNLKGMSSVLLSQTEEDRVMILSNQARLSAALSDNWQDSGNKISGIITDALSGDADAISQAAKLFGKAPEQLLDALKTGDLEGILAPLQKRIRDLGDNERGLNALSKTLGFPGTSQELKLLGSLTDDFKNSLAKLGVEQHTVESMTKAQEELRVAADGQLSAFDRARDSFNKWIIKIGGGEVIDFMKEFNLTSLLAIGIMGKPFLSALTGAGAKLLQFGGFASATNVSMAGTVSGFKGIAVKAVGAGKSLLAAIGPIGLVAAAVGALTVAAVSWYASGVEKELAATEAEQQRIHLDPNRVIKNIEQVQKQIDIDKATGNEVNPSALRLLERYNAQLDVMQGRTAALDVGVEATDVSSLAQPSTAAPLSSAEIAALTANVQMTSGAMEEKLDRSNELAEQTVALLREQLQQSRGIRPTPVAGRVAPARSGIGNAVAGGDL